MGLFDVFCFACFLIVKAKAIPGCIWWRVNYAGSKHEITCVTLGRSFEESHESDGRTYGAVKWQNH